MSILKYKYKAHKFVNYVFYVIVFLVGFFIGFGSKEINFSKLISQVLMIDNAQALDIGTIGNYEITDEFIYNEFAKYQENFLDEYPYVFCEYYFKGNLSPTLQCTAFNEEYLSRLYVSNTYSNNYAIGRTSGDTGALVFTISRLGVLSNANYYDYYSSSTSSAMRLYTNNSTGYRDYTNFDPKLITGSSSSYSYELNTLDFGKFMKLEFNENLFKDNSNFKEVCVPNNKDFAISTNNYELNEDETSEYYGSKSYSSYGFIWFPYYINRMESYLYDNSKTDNIWIPEEDETYFDLHPIFHYWFDTKEEIDRVWSLEDPGSFLNLLGYTDKYSYFGWYAHPFVVRYANSGLRQFSIFRFSDDVEFYSTLENGLDYFEKLENARNGNVCFYIRKDFDVTLLNTDEFGDKYGDLTIMGDEKLEILTTQNISNIDNKGLFEKVKLFLNKITKPINFVKDYIFDLYDSMPYILKLFIISVFGLIVIKILIGMVVR